MRKLFGKFVQFDPAEMQNGGGSGLGLWLSRIIVEHHGGAVGVRSDGVKGKGCVFYIDLPLHSVLSQDASQGESAALDIAHVTRAASIRSTDSVSSAPVAATPSAVADVTNPKAGSHGMLGLSRASSALDLAEEQKMLRYVTIRGSVLLSAYEHKYAPGLSCPTRAVSNRETRAHSPNESFHEDDNIVNTTTELDFSAVRDILTATVSSTVDLDKTPNSATSPLSKTPQSTAVQTEPSSTSLSAKSWERADHPHMPSRVGARSVVNILLVDDMASNRKVLRKLIMMLKRDISCFELADGIDVVHVVEKSLTSRPCVGDGGAAQGDMYYDMIFMDSQMTKMDGPEATAIIKSMLKYEGIVYGVTGDINSTERFLQAGAKEVFIKPMRKDRLKEIIDGESYLLRKFHVCRLLMSGGSCC
jgi:CheY-like chemotaxis protein